MDKNKYRMASAHLEHWDCRWAGAYFITRCTYSRETYFGAMVNGEMQLSQVGVNVDIAWHPIPLHAQNAILPAFVVMPNPIHESIISNDNAATACPVFTTQRPTNT